MIYKIQKGGNYGWSVMEGTHDFRPRAQERADADPPAGRRTFAHRFPFNHRRFCVPR